MDYYDAVAGQPVALERSAVAVHTRLTELDLDSWRQGTFGVVSMGASSHAGHALVFRLARDGRRAVNLAGSDVVALARSGLVAGPADSYLFISEGGRSRETIEAADLVPAGVRLGLTNVPDGPLAAHVDAVVALDAGEDSRVYTVGYTTTVQACGLLADALVGRDDGDDWHRLPELASQTLQRLAPAAAEAADVFARASSIDVIGAAGSYAAAAEAALLLRESTRICTATYETYQYLHGPMEPLTSANACLLIGDGREVSLARYLAQAGIPTVLVTPAPVDQERNLVVLTVPQAPTMSRAVLEILPVQLLAGEMARVRGLAIDGFLHHQDDTKVPAHT
ncbi:SIS domain-containing protein [Kribbella sp. NPDC026596]|uniref:SIS domain-containing protein n=1 Tax=Kribbella sp. NPDC026596 TaxID=3155122 RepID=UPI0033C3AA40